MIFYTLPGDTFSSILGQHHIAIGAPDLDSAAEWLAYTNPHLLRAGGPQSGAAYAIVAWQPRGIIYA